MAFEVKEDLFDSVQCQLFFSASLASAIAITKDIKTVASLRFAAGVVR